MAANVLKRTDFSEDNESVFGPRCLICNSAVKYVNIITDRECSVCNMVKSGSTSCINGHFVCDGCCMNELFKTIVDVCNKIGSTDPIEVMYVLVDNPAVQVHGAEYHVIVGASLIVAYCNVKDDKTELNEMLQEMINRCKSIPAGFCANSGSCGAGISAGTFYSIITKTNAFSVETYGLSNKLTSNCLSRIGDVGGPRCCRRSAMFAIEESVKFINRNMGISLDLPEKIICKYPGLNTECIGNKCPFFEVKG